MKCIHCGSDTNYKTRSANGMRCGACNHPFAFEPKQVGATYGLADGLFQRVIDDVSGGGKLTFTERQLWYEFNRRMLKKKFWRGKWGAVTGLSAVGGIAGTFVLAALGPVAILPFVAGVCGITYGAVMNKRAKENEADTPVYPEDSFRGSLLSRWIQAHGRPEKILVPPNRNDPPWRSSVAPDVSAYSFDRALIVQHADLAAMLVANNFHFENNCAIMSMDGYPYGLAPSLMEMLRRNPNLRVFALHDASEPGCRMPRALRGPDWFPDLSIPLIGLGLRPKHAQDLKMMVQRGDRITVSNEVKSTLTLPEIAWLEEGNRAELAALRPAKLMRAVFQGFAQVSRAEANALAGDTGPDVVIWTYDSPWVYSSGAEVYATDSFG
jgi:hypothetical protein